jgi:TRAP-type C4-dicarboxylate transport system permease large subunit
VSVPHIYLFLHIFGAFMIAAGGTMGEVMVAALRRTRNPRMALALLGAASRIPMMTIPGSILAIVFGSLLVLQGGYSFGEMWINVAYVGWLAAVGLSLAVIGPRLRGLAEVASRENAAGREDSAEFAQAAADPMLRMMIHVESGLLVLFLYLMVFKPGH